ncbi:MAG: OmpA family protein [Deltaproteobacteria bacterium]|jgi:chemotaxis protein MotB|nr:OmpA family protein [Deltaproteobacteria bacterium]
MSDEESRPEVKAPPPMGIPAWIVTYGDMMSLLLCFFIMLFILSKDEEEKYMSVVGSIQKAFGVNTADPSSPYNSLSYSPDNQGTASLGFAARELQNTVQEAIAASGASDGLQQSMVVDTENRGVVLRIYSPDLFEPGTAKLKPGAEKLFSPVVAAINRHQFNVLVRTNVTEQALVLPGQAGGTAAQNGPEAQGDQRVQAYPNVWELSAARSGAALQALITYGDIKPSRLKAMGTGDTDLRVPKSDPKSEYYNNRTEFVFYLPGTEFW